MKKKIFLLRSGFHFKLGMLLKLPSVFFWGIKLRNIDDEKAIVSIPYNWRTKNPFRSIYFAAQAGAAELSTGLLILEVLDGKKDVSMLVVGSSLEFYKKATGTIEFVCKDGREVKKVINGMEISGDTATYKMTSIGYNEEKEVVSKMELNWSFKRRG